MSEVTFKHKNAKALVVVAIVFTLIFLLCDIILGINAYSFNKKTIDDTILFSGTLESIEEKGSKDTPYYVFKVQEKDELFKIINLYNRLQSEQIVFKDIPIDTDLEFRVLKTQLNSRETPDIISLSVDESTVFTFAEGKEILVNNYLIGVAVTSVLSVGCLIALFFLHRYNKKTPKTITLTRSFIMQSSLTNRVKNPYTKKTTIIVLAYLAVIIISFIMFFLGAETFASQSFSPILIICGAVLFVASSVGVIVVSLKARNKMMEFFCELYDFKKLENYTLKDNRYYDLLLGLALSFEENGLKISLTKQEDTPKFIQFVTGKPPTDKALRKINMQPIEPFDIGKELFMPYCDMDLFAQATYKNAGDLFTLCLVMQPSKTTETLKKLIEFFYIIESQEQMQSAMEELGKEELPFFITFVDENLYNIIKKLNLNVRDLDEILANRKKLIKENTRKVSVFTKVGKVIDK